MAIKRNAKARLGVNLDHIATLRKLRGTPYPSMRSALETVEQAGADQITLHLREDRRHIEEEDVALVRKRTRVLLNLEMAATPEMKVYALQLKPDWICVVPEKREERTTEGGLDLNRNAAFLRELVQDCEAADIRVSLFIEPDLGAVREAAQMGASAVELHTGTYCNGTQGALGDQSKAIAKHELLRIKEAGLEAERLGLGVHCGHGLDLKTVKPLARLKGRDGKPLFQEYNIGHFLIAEGVLQGLGKMVRLMKRTIRNPGGRR